MSDTSTIDTTAYLTKTDGVLIEGRPDLFIPEAELQKVDASGADLAAEVAADRAAGKQECQQCGEWFMPRARSGGKPQKYCSEACRREADAERKANAPNAPQRETPADIPEPSIVAKHTEFALVAAEPKDDGCWFMDNQEHVVLPEQQAVAIYWNERGDLVIRQERSWCDDADHIVLIQCANIDAFIDKLCDVCGIPGVGR